VCVFFNTAALSSLSKKASQKATMIKMLSITSDNTLFCGRGKLTKNFKNTIHFPEASSDTTILLITILLQDEQPLHLIVKDYMQKII